MLESFDQLRETVLSCTRCRLAETRTNVVFGVGPLDAPVMLIGEGPGENEDLQGEPFVGRAGNLLDKMLDAVELSRSSNVYIANMVKCRPPKNRDPQPDEVECCMGYLRNQVKLIRPKIIVCLGRVAAQNIISPDFKVTKQHGHFFQRGETLLMGTLHPAALLRNPNMKPEAFADFLALRDKLDELGVLPAFEAHGPSLPV
ncbi:uracil-DNA glycosylase [Oscillospiraceae bacterium MB08-C2-2]|nr:uracil-DNA glycosylase [Oscillospiraceae bacterium MB08-C2-2]